MTYLIALAGVIAIAGLLWLRDTRINGKRPRPGEPAPAFSLPDQNGKARTLDEFRGRPLVLYFYPRDDTPDCAEQAMRFRNAMRSSDLAERLEKDGTDVIASLPEAFRAHIQAEIKRWAAVVKQAHLKAD